MENEKNPRCFTACPSRLIQVNSGRSKMAATMPGKKYPPRKLHLLTSAPGKYQSVEGNCWPGQLRPCEVKN